MKSYYLVIDSASGEPVSWFSLDYPEDAQIVGNLENYPNCYVRRVTREEIERYFELDMED